MSNPTGLLAFRHVSEDRANFVRLFVLSLAVLFGASACSSLPGVGEENANEEIADEGENASNPETDGETAYAEPAGNASLLDPPPAQDDPQGLLDRKARQKTLAEQRDAILVERALAAAKGFMENNEYEKAEAELLRARETAPNNADVLRELESVQLQLGKRPGEIRSLTELARQRYAVRRQQLRLEAEETFKTGMERLSRGDYDEAILRFETVDNHIRWSSVDVDWADLPDRVEAALADARSQKVSAEEERQRAIEDEIFSRLQEEEDEDRARQKDRTDTLLLAAIGEFKTEQYAKAEALAEEILKIDSKNDRAQELLESSKQARREKRQSDYIKERQERYLNWKEQIEETRIPYHGILNKPDSEFWSRISSLRSSERNLGLPELDPETAALQRAVQSERIPANFDDDDLDTVANTISTYTGIPVNIDPETRSEIEDSGASISLNLASIPVGNLLNIVTEQLGEDITWTVRNGTVIITKTEKAFGEPLIRIHPLADITFNVQDFAGPKIDEIPLPDEDSLEDNTVPPFGGPVDEPKPNIEPELIPDLIKSNIARESWENDAFACDITASNQLLVIHTADVQQLVAEFLDDLRDFSSTVVTVESRFITLTDAWIEEIGADFRGLGNEVGSDVVLDDTTIGLEDQSSQGLDNEGAGSDSISGAAPSAGVFFNDNSDGDVRARTENFWSNPLGSLVSTIGGGAFQFALLDDTEFNLVLNLVEKSVNATLITTPTVTVFNTNRAALSVVNEVSYLQDFEVDVANSSFIANPVIGIIQEGIVLDVKPTITYDRKYITLDILTTVADLLRPIETFEASLGGFSTPVTFQIPELKVSNTATTIVVPDGGSLILGGMKKIRYVNRRAAVPWLADIPLLGFFFQEKGVSDEVENLIVMVRATITDMAPLRNSLVSK